MNNLVQVFPVETPYCIIFWRLDGKDVSKTVCYSPSEAVQATNRFYMQGDFYNRYDHFEVEYCRIDERMIV